MVLGVQREKCKLDPECVERLRVYNREWAHRNYPTKGADYHYRTKYGITLEEKEQMAVTRDYRCDICGRKQGSLKDLHVDHNHTIKVVRGLLCGKCNRGIGMFEDNPAILLQAVKYLG